MTDLVRIDRLAEKVGTVVRVGGWVAHQRGKGKLVFVVLRDGSGTVQLVFFKGEVSEAAFAAASNLALECSVIVTGTVKADARSPGGVEIAVTDNGVGIGDVTRNSGLRNVRRRAESLGGSLTMTRPATGGTRLEWRVPIVS